jgi:endonuclease/exonuclease/phosphatase (EEP) superfamily protein YafD
MTLDCAWHHRLATGSKRPGSQLLVIVFCLLSVVVTPQYGTAVESPLRVMTYNIAGTFVPDHAPLAVMRPQHPDLVLLQEVRNTHHIIELSQALGLSYWHFAPYSKKRGGVAILSRWPLGPVRRLFWDNSPQGKVALAAQVDSPVGRFWACSVHLDNPLNAKSPISLWQKVLFLWQEFFTATLRTQQAQELSAWLLGLEGDEGIILGGDFNSLPLAGADRHLRQYFSDALSISLQQYFTGIYWGSPHYAILPRLDFIYHSPHWQVVDAQVLQQQASDHFPVFAILSTAVQVPAPLATPGDTDVLAGPALRRF